MLKEQKTQVAKLTILAKKSRQMSLQSRQWHYRGLLNAQYKHDGTIEPFSETYVK